MGLVAVAHVHEEGTRKWWRFDDETVTVMPDGPVGEKADHGGAPNPVPSGKKVGLLWHSSSVECPASLQSAVTFFWLNLYITKVLQTGNAECALRLTVAGEHACLKLLASQHCPVQSRQPSKTSRTFVADAVNREGQV